jgi:hypothetical protein
MDLFAEWRQDIASEPFTHEAEWSGDRLKESAQ